MQESGAEPNRHGVFRQQAEAADDAEQQPVGPGIAVQRPQIGPQRQRPEQGEQRIGGHEQAEPAEHRQGQHGQRRPEGDALVVEAAGDGPAGSGSQRIAEHGQRLDAEQAVAEQRGGQPDQRRDAGRLGKVAPVEVLRPGPVLRFVDIKRDAQLRHHPEAPGKQQRRQAEQ